MHSARAILPALAAGLVALAGCGDGRAEACAKSCGCGTLGYCDARPGGTGCAPTKPEHCAKSNMCELFGKCTLKGNVCVAGSDEDCAKSRGCESIGACTVLGTSCAVPPRPPSTPRRRRGK